MRRNQPHRPKLSDRRTAPPLECERLLNGAASPARELVAPTSAVTSADASRLCPDSRRTAPPHKCERVPGVANPETEFATAQNGGVA